MSAERCTTHHICECKEKRMEELEEELKKSKDYTNRDLIINEQHNKIMELESALMGARLCLRRYGAVVSGKLCDNVTETIDSIDKVLGEKSTGLDRNKIECWCHESHGSVTDVLECDCDCHAPESTRLDGGK